MPQPKKYETSTDQKRAWNAQNIQRIEVNARRDGKITRDVLKKAVGDYIRATGDEMSVSRLLLQGAKLWIDANLPTGWLDENGNRPPADTDE